MRFVDIEFDRDIVGINSRAAKDEGFFGSHTNVLDAIDGHRAQGADVGGRHAHQARETRITGNAQRNGAGCFATHRRTPRRSRQAYRCNTEQA